MSSVKKCFVCDQEDRATVMLPFHNGPKYRICLICVTHILYVISKADSSIASKFETVISKIKQAMREQADDTLE